MSSIGEELAADLEAAIADYGQSFSWNGTEYPCVIRWRDATLIVAKALFPDGQYPPRGSGIVVDGQDRQVTKLNDSALIATAGGFIEDKPFVDDPSDPALLITFGQLISS